MWQVRSHCIKMVMLMIPLTAGKPIIIFCLLLWLMNNGTKHCLQNFWTMSMTWNILLSAKIICPWVSYCKLWWLIQFKQPEELKFHKYPSSANGLIAMWIFSYQDYTTQKAQQLVLCGVTLPFEKNNGQILGREDC